jgi:hypothetical protein
LTTSRRQLVHVGAVRTEHLPLDVAGSRSAAVAKAVMASTHTVAVADHRAASSTLPTIDVAARDLIVQALTRRPQQVHCGALARAHVRAAAHQNRQLRADQ